MMESVAGTIESISRPYSDGWRFTRVTKVGTVVGCLPPDVGPGDYCVFEGQFTEHPKYGRQFKAERVRKDIPRDTMGILSYLDNKFPWIGPTVARAMVDEFKENLFRVIEESPGELARIRGVTAERAREIHNAYLAIKGDRELDLFFSTHGISAATVNRLISTYGTKKNAISVIKANPYELAGDVWGIGFKKADTIALSMGIPRDGAERIRAGIHWTLSDAATGEGHTCLPETNLIERSAENLECSENLVGRALSGMIESKALLFFEGYGYDPDYYHAEVAVAEKLRALATTHHDVLMNELSPQDLEEMDSDQLQALDYALKSQILIITGGPGVGKTWTINKIIQALGPACRISLAAPTGKAAKRMQEATRLQAVTLHRLLEYAPFIPGFVRNARKPLDSGTLIIDETSMIDIRLMRALLDAVVPEKHQVIFVGDVDQLPSVGPGRVLGDMIDSGTIPVVRLKTLHRQAKKSYINRNAQNINEGRDVEFPSFKDGDFLWVPCEDKEQIAPLIVKVCEKFAAHYGYSYDQIQVLCPQKKGPTGTMELNRLLRPALNPEGAPVPGTSFFSGDRVIQIRNNYDLEVFNGDIGRVVGVDPEDRNSIMIAFDGVGAGAREIGYPIVDIGELQPAYALTVHKSQGSEFPVVVMPMHTTNSIMLVRNLFYTAVTRARKYVVIVGTLKAIKLAIRKVDSSKRYSNLQAWLRGEANNG